MSRSLRLILRTARNVVIYHNSLKRRRYLKSNLSSLFNNRNDHQPQRLHASPNPVNDHAVPRGGLHPMTKKPNTHPVTTHDHPPPEQDSHLKHHRGQLPVVTHEDAPPRGGLYRRPGLGQLPVSLNRLKVHLKRLFRLVART